MHIFHNVQTENDFEFYYSHIYYECKHFLRNNLTNYDWRFVKFYDSSIGNQEQYAVCYKAFDYTELKDISITISVTKKGDSYVTTSSNPSSANI